MTTMNDDLTINFSHQMSQTQLNRRQHEHMTPLRNTILSKKIDVLMCLCDLRAPKQNFSRASAYGETLKLNE